MDASGLDQLGAEIATIRTRFPVGRVAAVQGGVVEIAQLPQAASTGDRVLIEMPGRPVAGEIVAIEGRRSIALVADPGAGLAVGLRVVHLGPDTIAPDDSWIGRVVDAYGAPLDGLPLLRGTRDRGVREAPPPAYDRRALGAQIHTGLGVFDAILPLVRGQRVGLFAGSGVGKSTLMAQLTAGVTADLFVIALIGERGREVRDFLDRVLGPAGLSRAVVVAATADRSPLERRRAALTAMAIAEHFRDAGRHVVYVADSVTRFADAHREVAAAAGETGSVRGYPPSTQQAIASLCERAGPGAGTQGDITAIFSVLVAGSDMEEPVADILRGVLDGHIVLSRQIAERGRFPAIDVLRSISRAPLDTMPPDGQALAARARRALSVYEDAELMLRSGLYAEGSDAEIDWAKAVWPSIDTFVGARGDVSFEERRSELRRLLESGS